MVAVDFCAVKLLGTLILVVVLASSCGKSGTSLYSAAKTRACLASHGVRIGGQLDFVATTATGGAFRSVLATNSVTVAFGDTVTDADNINQAYHRFHAKNVGIGDVLRQQGNAVMLWHAHPADTELARITGCLK